MKTICLNNNDNVAVAILDLKKKISINNLLIKNFAIFLNIIKKSNIMI